MVHRQCDERGEGHDAQPPICTEKISNAWPKVVQCVVGADDGDAGRLWKTAVKMRW